VGYTANHAVLTPEPIVPLLDPIGPLRLA